MPLSPDGAAPYAPPQAIIEFVTAYRDRGLSSPFTAAVLARAGVPESLIPRTLVALRLLGLADDEGRPTPSLDRYAKAPSEEEARAAMQDAVRTAYEEVFAFVDPSTDDGERVRGAFRTFSPRGQQPRMVTLFLGLCEFSGIIDEGTRRRVAPRLVKKNQGVSVDSRKRAPSPRLRGTTPDIPETEPRPAHDAVPPAAARSSPADLHPFVQGLLESLPEPGAVWSLGQRNKWTTAALAAFDLIYELPHEDSDSAG